VDPLCLKLGPAGVTHSPAAAASGSDAVEGKVVALVAKFDEVDYDYDIIAPGAVVSGTPVVLSSYGHDVMRDQARLPVGKGQLVVEGSHLVFKGSYFLQIGRARDAFETLKSLAELAQWSWGFLITQQRAPTPAEAKRGARRVLTKVRPIEVSPVLLGAGRGTRTLDVKRDAERAAAMMRERERFLRHIRHKHPQWPNESDEIYRRRLAALYFTAA
jgi:hypothetical protein